MLGKSVYDDGAVLRAMDGLASHAAWKIACDVVNGKKYDSENNGFFWADAAEKEKARTVEIIEAIGGPHAEYVLNSFNRLVEVHIKNLSKGDENAKPV